jgi:hypothetical protein
VGDSWGRLLPYTRLPGRGRPPPPGSRAPILKRRHPHVR